MLPENHKHLLTKGNKNLLYWDEGMGILHLLARVQHLQALLLLSDPCLGISAPQYMASASLEVFVGA